MSAAGPQQDVAGRIRALRQECQHLSQKLAELEQDIHEHELVHDTLGSVDSERKCFRLVGGVLVERTVQEVLPAVEQHKAGIKQLIDTLSSQLKKKEEELNKLQSKHMIKPARSGEVQAQSDSSGAAGVLV